MIQVGKVAQALVDYIENGKWCLVLVEVTDIHADIEQEWPEAIKPSIESDNPLKKC